MENDQIDSASDAVLATRKSFELALNRHGFGFQYRVLQEAREAALSRSRWTYLGSEVPVETRGTGTRIDFILNHVAEWSDVEVLMICECKRVNPAYSEWCFIKDPHYLRATRSDSLVIETTGISSGTFSSLAQVKYLPSVGKVFSVGFPVKKKKAIGCDQPARGSGDDAIENAITQVLRGVNGYINLLGAYPHVIKKAKAVLLPVVFTTADLFASEADLSKAELHSGNVDLSKERFNKLPWLLFEYHSSPGVKHSFSPRSRSGNVTDLITSEFVRTVAIVNHEGIREFLDYSETLIDQFS